VIFGLRSANGYLDALLNAGIPTVTLNHPPRGTEHGCVSVDYAGGGRLAAQALLDAGHEKVFVLKSQSSNEWTSHAAAEGFSQVFKRAGKTRILTLSDMDGVKDIGDVAALAKAIRKQVTAVFCGDYYAVQILNALENLGVRVPDDIAVMGFDDTAQVSGNGLKLTSIGFDKQKMGRLAAKLLMQMMPPNPSLHSGSLVVPTFLVQGDTTRSA